MTKKLPSMKTFLEVADGLSVSFELGCKRINQEFVGRYIWNVPNEDHVEKTCKWEGFETLAACVQDFIIFRKKEMKGIVK